MRWLYLSRLRYSDKPTKAAGLLSCRFHVVKKVIWRVAPTQFSVVNWMLNSVSLTQVIIAAISFDGVELAH